MKKGTGMALTAAGAFVLLGLMLFAVPGIRFSSYLSFSMAVLCFVWFLLGRWAEHSRWGWRCRKLFFCGCAAVLLLLGILEGLIILQGEQDNDALPVDAVIVLGAGVNGERPSLTLQTRIDRALDYILEHPGVPVVLSGGQGPGETITEAECMRRGLTGHKNRPTDTPMTLLLEENSTSTAENFAFSKEILQEHGIDTDTAVIGVVTNDFHIFRAKLIAQRAGLHTLGVSAELPWWWLSANYYIREAFALVKTVIFD